MGKFLLKSKNRVIENRGALSIHYCYGKEKYDIPFLDDFKNIVSILDCNIEPNMGILPHRHENIDLITVLLKGTLVQKNNFGETCLLTPGKVQVMSAGSGVSHFEYNKSTGTTLNCIQFHISPRVNYTAPKNKIFSLETNKQGFQKIIPAHSNIHSNPQKSNEPLLYYGFLGSNTKTTYHLKKGKKGILILNISGTMDVNGEILENRDTLVLKNTSQLNIVSHKSTKFFIFEI